MNDPLLALDKIEEIITAAREWDFSAQVGAYAAAMVLVTDLEAYVEDEDNEDVRSRGYVSEKVTFLRWHVGAMFGMDTDNGHDGNKHFRDALGMISIIRPNVGPQVIPITRRNVRPKD